MKLIVLMFALIFLQFQLSKSEQFDITPLQINFTGVEAKGDSVIAYGDAGSMLISYDNGVIWEQIKVFENHQIIKIFWNDDKIIAINEIGQIAIAFDNFNTWEIIAELDISILGIIELPTGYFIRTPQKVLTIDDDFQILNESALLSQELASTFKFKYRKSIANFQQNLFAAIDSSRFIRYDEKLQIIDTLDFHSLFGTNQSSMYEIDISDGKFIIRTGNQIIMTNDFIDSELIFDIKLSGFYKIIKSDIFHLIFSPYKLSDTYDSYLRLQKVISHDSSVQVTGVQRVRETIFSLIPEDFIINKNKLIIVGSNKLIVSMSLSDTLCIVNSCFFGYLDISVKVYHPFR